MHLSVVDEYADVTGIRTGERTFGHLLLDTLEDSRHEAEVDCTTDNAVVELKLSAPLEVGNILGLDIELGVLAVNLELGVELAFCRAYEEVNLTELTCTAGLLLVAVLGGSHLGNGLAIRNLWLIELYVHAELVDQTPLDDVDMLLAVALENGLAELLVVVYDNGRVLGGNLLQCITELLLILNDLSLDGALVLGSRELDLVVVDA